jgi:hypothetical protein
LISSLWSSPTASEQLHHSKEEGNIPTGSRIPNVPISSFTPNATGCEFSDCLALMVSVMFFQSLHRHLKRIAANHFGFTKATACAQIQQFQAFG